MELFNGRSNSEPQKEGEADSSAGEDLKNTCLILIDFTYRLYQQFSTTTWFSLVSLKIEARQSFLAKT